MENRLSQRSKPVEVSETQFFRETAAKPVDTWDSDAIEAARAELLAQFNDPEATLIGMPVERNIRHCNPPAKPWCALFTAGRKQVEGIETSVRESIARGSIWQVLVSQTVMSRINAPLLEEALPLQPWLLRKLSRGALGMAMDEAKAGKEGAQLARMYVGMGKYSVPMNPDAWDGFQAERRKVG